MDVEDAGCVSSDILFWITFLLIVGITGIRFIFAIIFTALIGWRLGIRTSRGAHELKRRKDDIRQQTLSRLRNHSVAPTFSNNEVEIEMVETDIPPTETIENDISDPTRMHILVAIPCYTEGSLSLRTTLDSVANSYYPSTHKCLILIADGIVQGRGNSKSTAELILDMMDFDDRAVQDRHPEAFPYNSLGDGSLQRNMAKVYVGWYKYTRNDTIGRKKKRNSKKQKEKEVSYSEEVDINKEDSGRLLNSETLKSIRNRKEGRVPVVLIVKTGLEEEKSKQKPGNRGKRDSQILLMSFLSKVVFDERMSELEFEMFYKIFSISGIHPDRFEAVLMVDADTMIFPDAITHMVACLMSDTKIMGLCGETRIANKWASWVTEIQVFEYFISHHLSKAFESLFGSVICLPGCFSMYRIKAPKGDEFPGYEVPILANPDIVEEYSKNEVSTLHMKNLLLLGEDRYLTTLMLRTFPKRKTMFVPLAICKTVVPDKFKVLMSQRRRWINSTIHNLLELLLVQDLCGSFCFSMQFVVFMELIGTIILPAAVCFGIFLIIFSFLNPNNVPWKPLILQGVILLLPAILIFFTARKPIFFFWWLLYLISIPIWNFILPLYAFWNFDDFTWGQTRRTNDTMKRGKPSNQHTQDGNNESEIEDMKESHSQKPEDRQLTLLRWSEWQNGKRNRPLSPLEPALIIQQAPIIEPSFVPQIIAVSHGMAPPDMPGMVAIPLGMPQPFPGQPHGQQILIPVGLPAFGTIGPGQTLLMEGRSSFYPPPSSN
ncbi:Chitin synthase, class 3 [Nowakowskiella sp. JEL0078]|nr:Chitin synthase, class 3 [Nowakowskiella sp. JEL0078]